MTTLAGAGKPAKGIVDVVEVKRHGSAIVIPETLTLERADEAIHARMDYEKQVVAIHAPIQAPFPFEGAYALWEVLTNEFGWANSLRGTTMLSVPIGPSQTVQVPWGQFSLPNVEGIVQTSIEQDDLGVSRFVISGSVKRMHEKVVTDLVEKVKERVRHHSIYKGKAFRVRLFDDKGRRIEMPEPKFIDLSTRIAGELILPDDTAASVATNIFTPIEQTARVTKFGIPLKRGVLLAGPFGTGKTMVARVTAEKAFDHGWTYVEVERIHEFSEVAKLVMSYGDKEAGIVLFCEDIDRIMHEDRDEGIDMVLNVIDGVESKGSAMMVVLTTNDLDSITQAMLRPGRLDAIIHVGPPDRDAAIQLARQYGRGLIDPNDPLTQAGEAMAGKIPAVIREIVERSKLAAIRLTTSDDDLVVTDEALLFAATEMQAHVDLLTPKEPDMRSEMVKAADIMSDVMREGWEKGFPTLPFLPITSPAARVQAPGYMPDSQSKGRTGKRVAKTTEVAN